MGRMILNTFSLSQKRRTREHQPSGYRRPGDGAGCSPSVHLEGQDLTGRNGTIEAQTDNRSGRVNGIPLPTAHIPGSGMDLSSARISTIIHHDRHGCPGGSMAPSSRYERRERWGIDRCFRGPGPMRSRKPLRHLSCGSPAARTGIRQRGRAMAPAPSETSEKSGDNSNATRLLQVQMWVHLPHGNVNGGLDTSI